MSLARRLVPTAIGPQPPNAFVAATTDTASATIYTFTSHAIGTAYANRYVVVGILFANAGSLTVSGVTIGGNAASRIIGPVTPSNDQEAALYGLAVPGGSTATIEVTLSGSGATGMYIGVYAIYPASTTPVDAVANKGTTTSSPITDLATTAGGWAIAISHHRNSAATVWSWTGADTIVEDVNTTFETFNYSFVHFETVATATTNDLSVSWTGSNNGGSAAASWGP